MQAIVVGGKNNGTMVRLTESAEQDKFLESLHLEEVCERGRNGAFKMTEEDISFVQERMREAEKNYYQMNNVGKAKYTVSKHDGVQTHKDGSPFYDISIFKNKKKRDDYIKGLRADGYLERGEKKTKGTMRESSGKEWVSKIIDLLEDNHLFYGFFNYPNYDHRLFVSDEPTKGNAHGKLVFKGTYRSMYEQLLKADLSPEAFAGRKWHESADADIAK
jgi:hypothetical protein